MRNDRWHAWRVGVGYIALFLLLDWVSYIRPLHGLNITPWSPQPALAIALLLWNRRWLWVVWISLIAADLVVRGAPPDWFAEVTATTAIAICYAAIARALADRLTDSRALETRRDLLWFTLIVVTGALACAVAYVSVFILAGLGPSDTFFEAVIRYWIGDAVGIVVTLPILLVLMDPIRRSSLLDTLRDRQALLIGMLIVALLAAVFARDASDLVKFFYLLLLPVVWASARLGLRGAVLASVITQVGLIVGVQSVSNTDLTVFELQVLMVALTMTALFLGIAVDERERAVVELRRSLGLAAAGQMAAALAHELSQPLAALGNYAQASRLIASASEMPDQERLVRLLDVSQRLADEARRASDVVKRLREFFLTGGTQLRSVQPAALLADAVAAHSRRAETQGIRIELEIADELPSLMIDPVQVSVVLRNLITNALDATARLGERGEVSIRARRSDGALVVEVHDNGGGVDATKLRTLFEPGHSGKPGGMGVGLGICRAIVEAHGGRLWAEPGPTGRFSFTLPFDESERSGSPDAQ